MNIIKQKFYQSPVALTSAASLIYFIVKYWVGFEIPHFDQFVTLLLTALIAFGIINNPTSKTTL